MSRSDISLAVDIGGTFTDVVFSDGSRILTTKVLTTPATPEVGLLQGVEKILRSAGSELAAVNRFVHGTTLATNALIERKGARTALICTSGFRDILEIGTEGRYDQYRLALDRPAPLVRRPLRFEVAERIDALGAVRLPVKRSDVEALVPVLVAKNVESVAVALMHSYSNPSHEKAVGQWLADLMPGLSVSLSSQVCPEIREYERTSTTAVNAYVQPMMARYLTLMEAELRERGFTGSLTLITSGGGVTGLETARAFPVRLIESGPAGGTIFARRVAQAMNADRALAFDMGGTTAKVTLIDDFEWNNTRAFEVDRVSRFMKGSGLPIRIPCIDMVEIGTGGGSIAKVDTLKRVLVGPESASSDPGPACYDRGGLNPAVTDADLVLGLLDPSSFAGGSIKLDPELSARALHENIGRPLELSSPESAHAIYEAACEAMANAARVHCVERGADSGGRTVIAFGGAAPLHVARVAEKIGALKVVVPHHAGVGSAVGFLNAPFSYETVRTRYMRLDAFDPDGATAVLDEMSRETLQFVAGAASGVPVAEHRVAHMRYVGQGQEIVVEVPSRNLTGRDALGLRDAFEAEYSRLFKRAVPSAPIEIMAWSVSVSSSSTPPEPIAEVERKPAEPRGFAPLYHAKLGMFTDVARYNREDLEPGMCLRGPAVIVEQETSTFVTESFEAHIDAAGSIVMERRIAQ